MFDNLSAVEIMMLLGAVGYVIYTFLPTGKGKISTGGIGDFFKKIRGKVEDAVDLSDKVSAVSGIAIVAEWEDLYDMAEKIGNKDLMAQLDAMWPSLNPKLIKEASLKVEVPNE